MFRDVKDGLLGAGLHTFRAAPAKITLERRPHIIMDKDTTKRAGHYTFGAGDTFFMIDFHDTIGFGNGLHGTIVHAFGIPALIADNGHPDYRMGIDYHHTDGTFFGIINSEMFDGANKLTHPAAGASLSNDSQLSFHFHSIE